MAQPKYLEIQNQLKDEILSGKFNYGDRFYSEAELKDKFNVSSITVIRAVKELVMDGYLVRYQGKGTYVSHSVNDTLVTIDEKDAFGLKENDADDDNASEERMDVVSVTKGNDEKYLKALNLRNDQSYYAIERVRYLKDQPYVDYFTYLPEKYVRPEWLNNKDNFMSVFVKVKQDFNIFLNDEPFNEDITIVQASKHVSANLMLPESYPVVRQAKTIKIKGADTPIYYTVAFRRVDHFSLSFSSPDFHKENN